MLESLETRQLLSASALGSSPVAVPSSLIATPLATQAISTGLTASQVRNAYGLNQIRFDGGTVAGDGAGQTIAIVTAYNDPNIAQDLAQFDSQMGLSAPPSLTTYLQTGQTQTNPGWSLETALDVEWAHAMAPGAKLVLVEARSASLTDLFSAVNFARSLSGVVAVSMSWGAPEFLGENAYDSLFTTPAGHIGGSNLPGGVTFVAASGDTGAGAGVSYPAASSNVLSVGATSLSLGAGSSSLSQAGWAGSTGGSSVFEPVPAYQEAAQSASGIANGQRTVPDVAAVGDPATGLAVYDSIPYAGHSGWFAVGGTSASTPQWAGLIAVADQGRALAGIGSLANAQAALYAIPSAAFHGVTSGFNGYPATAGYNLVAGLGTPIASSVVAGLLTSQMGSNIVGLPSPTPATVFHPVTLNAGFLLSGGGSSGVSATAGTSSSTPSTTSLFPVNIVVIIVPVDGKEVLVILPPAPVAPSPFASTSHYVEAQSSIVPLTEPGQGASMLSALAKFGQGPAIGLPLPLYERINSDNGFPPLIDLVLPFEAQAPPVSSRQVSRQRLAKRMVRLPEASLSVLPLLGRQHAGVRNRRADSLRPAPINPSPGEVRRARRVEEESPATSMGSALAGAAVIAGGGFWLTLRESERRRRGWTPGRFEHPLSPGKRRSGLLRP